MESIGAFPGTVGMDPCEHNCHYSACGEAYKYVFGQVLTQQLLGIVEYISSLKASYLFQPPQDLLQRISRKNNMCLFSNICVFV